MSKVDKLVMLFPVAFFLLVALLLAVPITRKGAIWLLEENHPVEMLTFIFLLAGGLRGLALAWQVRREELVYAGFYLLFALGLLLTAMEEMAWGQKLLNFPTPSMWKEMNAQGEMTLHNLHGLHGRSDLFRLAFGVGGLIGVRIARVPALRAIAAPAVLLPWFLLITTHSALDAFSDIVAIRKDLDAALTWLSELIEMLIGMAGFLYIELNARRRARMWPSLTAIASCPHRELP